MIPLLAVGLLLLLVELQTPIPLVYVDKDVEISPGRYETLRCGKSFTDFVLFRGDRCGPVPGTLLYEWNNAY